MDLTPQSTTVTTLEDRSWLGSAHGTESTDTITLDLSKFTSGTHYSASDLEIKSGQRLAKVTATGLYAPYDHTKTNGQEIGAGYLFSTIAVKNPTGKAGAALLNHGKVKTAKLPSGNDLNAGFLTGTPNIIHV